MSDNENLLISPQMRSALSHTRLCKLGIFGDLCSINNLQYRGLLVNDDTFDNKLEY